jgi:hypothetical protein
MICTDMSRKIGYVIGSLPGCEQRWTEPTKRSNFAAKETSGTEN